MASLSEFDLTYGGIMSRMAASLPKEWLASLEQQLGVVRGILAEFESGATRIKGNGDLTDAGKSHRLRELARETAHRLEGQKKTLRDYDQRLEVESSKLRTDTTRTPQDALVAELRAAEIRRYLNELDPLELQARYLAAASEPQFYEMMLAVEAAPLAMLDAKTLDEGRALRAAAQSPERARLISDLQAMKKTIADAIQTGIAILQANGYEPDPIANMARGDAA